MTVKDLLPRLEAVRPRGAGKWSARCPSHQDRSPSLSITETGTRILLHCFSGCDTAQIVAALGFSLRDLFADARTPHGHRPTPKRVHVDRVARAFQFDLGALDLRLRAERIIETGKKLDVANLSDSELDRALSYAAQAHADVERAELFEHVANTLRMREFTERDHEQQRRIA
jgi:hypothetical protein